MVFVEYAIAIDFPNAFPPTVSADTIPVNNTVTTVRSNIASPAPKLASNLIITSVLAAPLMTPQISPMTSLQKLENRSAFRIMATACFEPFTFSDAIAWNGSSLAEVEAIPIISKTIPIRMSTSTTSIPSPHDKSSSRIIDVTEKKQAMTSVIRPIKTLHLLALDMENFILFFSLPVHHAIQLQTNERMLKYKTNDFR